MRPYEPGPDLELPLDSAARGAPVVCLARQPILDRRLRLYGYELLFRDGPGGMHPRDDPDRASGRVLADSLLLLGLDRVTAGRKAFVNVTERVLLDDHLTLFPPRLTVVELLEDVPATAEVVRACERLRHAGYTLALDDVVADRAPDGITAHVDLVKVDVLANSPTELVDLARRFRDKRLVAEKVETFEQQRIARAAGFHYFQGFFFAHPEPVARPDIPAYKLHYLEILKAIHAPDVDFRRIEEIVKREPSLAYRLLRYVNSVHFGWRSRVDGVRRALALLGEREIRRWTSFIALASLGSEHPDELLVQTVTRARFCELLGERCRVDGGGAAAFLLGLFSMLDVMLGRPLDETLDDLPVPDAVRHGLLGGHNVEGAILRLAVAYERGRWDALGEEIDRLGLPESEIPAMYLDAVEWTTRTLPSRAQDAIRSDR